MRKLLLFIPVMMLVGTGVILSQSSTTNPHGNLKWDCQDCHTSESWSSLRKYIAFDHDETGFHLTGAHETANCIGCHKSLEFSHVGVACVDCHTDQHEGQLGLACQNCHTPRNWENRKDILELHAQKGFALTGVHAVADCESCHRGSSSQDYAGTPMNCIDCHTTEFTATTNPSHTLAGFQTDCQQCHHTASGTWQNATYAHTALFPLTGGHRITDCNSCHATTYAGIATDCYACHSSEFAATSDPDHEQGGFDHDCALCHNTNRWEPANFDHSVSGFPLTGRHVSVSCNSCHASGYTGTPSDCYACHQSDFQNASDPNHVQANFDQDCTSCHSTNGWTPSSFEHNNTSFPLTGRHVTASCISCHAFGYSGTQSACFACHQSDYDGTTDPNHVSANFPNDCLSCHTTSGWTPSTWDHDAQYFPIYSGTHRNEWNDCSDCHVQPANYAVFECIDCHQHSRTETDNHHNEVNNYQYLSTACYSCHPRGTH